MFVFLTNGLQVVDAIRDGKIVKVIYNAFVQCDIGSVDETLEEFKLFLAHFLEYDTSFFILNKSFFHNLAACCE